MKREYWETNYFSDKSPAASWVCPHCEAGSIGVQISQIKEIPNQEVTKSRKSVGYSGEGKATFIFSTEFICTTCSQKTIVSGSGEYVNRFDEKVLSAAYIGKDRMRKFYPKYFLPSLDIISIPRSVPQNIKDQIESSFPIFWIDKGACANKLRVSLELILDDQGVDKKCTTKNGEQSYSLHKRILLFEMGNEECGKLLKAMKWLGNEGSHQGNVERNDLLDGFEIFEHLLMELYPDNKIRISELADRLNKKQKA